MKSPLGPIDKSPSVDVCVYYESETEGVLLAVFFSIVSSV